MNLSLALPVVKCLFLLGTAATALILIGSVRRSLRRY